MQDTKLQAMGPAAVGLITMHHYNADLDNPENRRFVAAWKNAYGVDSTPDFVAVGGYDGMAALVHAIHATHQRLVVVERAVTPLADGGATRQLTGRVAARLGATPISSIPATAASPVIAAASVGSISCDTSSSMLDDRITARSMMFSNSRILPGHAYVESR